MNGAGDLTFVNSLVNFTVRDKVIYKIKAKILTPANDIVIEPICMFYDGSHYIHLHANKNAHFNKKNVFYADYNNMSGDVFIGLNYELLLDSSWHIFEARVGNNKVFFYIDGKEIGYFVSGKERRKGVNLPDKPLRPAVVIYSPGDIAEMYVDWIKIEME